MESRSGELAMRPLPAVLLDLHEDMATGTLSLRRGRVAKTVDLVNGNPVSTASTPRDETLGHFLVSSGVITEEQHRQAVARAAGEGGKLGEALIALKILTLEQLIDQLGKQARHKLVQALRWPQGAWRFDPSTELPEGLQLRMVEVVIGGLRETAVEDPSRLARLEGLTFELTARGKRLRHELKRTFGEATLDLLAASGGAPLPELERVVKDRVQARLAIDAMLLCDAITTVASQVGLGAAVGRIPLAKKAVAPAATPKIKEPAARATPEPARPSTNTVVAPEPEPDEDDEGLFDLLFDDVATVGDDGAAPLEVPEGLDADEDSGVVAVAALTSEHAQVEAARQALTAEYQRIKGADHYAVLKIHRRAPLSEIQDAYRARTGDMAKLAPSLSDPRDRGRLDELQAAYAGALSTLADDRSRATYDRELAGGELIQVAPAIDTELMFRTAEDLMAKGRWDQAVHQLRTVIARAPNEADYHAALGWCVWHAGKEQPDAADAARAHLNSALAINPDHAAAHDYKGRLEAKLRRDDDEALFHLERAIDLEPLRTEALADIENLLVGRGELRRYEKVLKRLLFRLRGKGNTTEAKAWARLARLYFEHLEEPQHGAAAAASARKIAPNDTDVAAIVQRAEQVRTRSAQPTRSGWREALGDPKSGAELVASTAASGHVDAAFLAASTMVALGTADATLAALYEKHRVRGLHLPTKPLSRDQWGLLRHKDDAVDLGALMELVAPAVHALAPMTLADSELDASMAIPNEDVPAAFGNLRAAISKLLGVDAAPVFHRVELGNQIHVIAADPPVLVAGDEALTSAERPELVFRLVRAMTFLWPGRAVGASRPGRVLRAIVMAIFREASGSTAGSDDPLAPQATDAIARLPMPARTQARAAAMRLVSRGGGLNLSLWARSLSRTADRAGMLLAGDVAAAFAGAAEVGELDRDLQEFAYSVAHVTLRAQLGLSAA